MTSPDTRQELAISARSSVEGLSNESIISHKNTWQQSGAQSRLSTTDTNDPSTLATLAASLNNTERSQPLSPERESDIDLTLLRVQQLQSMPTAEREDWLATASHQAKLFDQLGQASQQVHKQALSGFAPALIDNQKQVVALTDKLDLPFLAAEAGNIRTALSQAQSPAMQAHLSLRLEEARWQLAAPFVERARLASFLLNNKRPYESERTLELALSQDIPAEALASPTLAGLRSDAVKRLAELKTENRLVTNFNTHLPAIDLDQDGQVSQSEVQSAKTSASEGIRHLANFLDKHYGYRSGQPGTSGGITPADILSFARRRAANLLEIPED